jgi:hypothetical protein
MSLVANVLLSVALGQLIPTTADNGKILGTERFETPFTFLDMSYYEGGARKPFVGTGQHIARCERGSACVEIQDDNGGGFSGDDTLGFRFLSIPPGSPTPFAPPLIARYLLQVQEPSSGSCLIGNISYESLVGAGANNEYVLFRIDDGKLSLDTHERATATPQFYQPPVSQWMAISQGLVRDADGGLRAVLAIELDDVATPAMLDAKTLRSEKTTALFGSNYGQYEIAKGTSGTSFQGRYRFDEVAVGTGYLPTRVLLKAASMGDPLASNTCVPVTLQFRSAFVDDALPAVDGLSNLFRLSVENGRLSNSPDCRDGVDTLELGPTDTAHLSGTGGVARVTLALPGSYVRGPALEVRFSAASSNLYGCECQSVPWVSMWWVFPVLLFFRRKSVA